MGYSESACTAQSFTGETPVPRWLRGMAGTAMPYLAWECLGGMRCFLANV